ncbi:MAG: hypothetical protein AAGA58_15235 [Verrucomicrobiota bacterium]
MSELLDFKQWPEGTGEIDPYFVPGDWARLEYGRLLWKVERVRERLLKHWTDPRHPYRERFIEKYRPLVERLLESAREDNEKMDEEFRAEGESLRTVVREIPPVFGSFY